MSISKREAVDRLAKRIKNQQKQIGNNITHEQAKKIVAKYQNRIDNKNKQ